MPARRPRPAALPSRMSDDDVRALIVARIQAHDGHCNSHYTTHIMGQLRALVAVLTGDPPPSTGADGNIIPLLRAAKIPYKLIGDQVDFPEKWLVEHGFTVDGDDIDHPKWSRSW